MPFQKAVRYGSRLRMAVDGPTGSGKTFTALRLAKRIIERRYGGEGRIALIDTEKGSSTKYAMRDGEVVSVNDGRFDFDYQQLNDYHPQKYLNALKEAIDAGEYKVIIIDSLSHAWAGPGGVLELKDQKAKQSGNSYTAWGDVTPIQNKLIDTIVGSPVDVIVTLRTKMEHVQERDEKTGKTTVRKIGMAPVQRDGVEFEFDIVLDMDTDHYGHISKTRCHSIDGKTFTPPDEDLADILVEWLDGPEAPPPPEPTEDTPVQQEGRPTPPVAQQRQANGRAEAERQQAEQSRPATTQRRANPRHNHDVPADHPARRLTPEEQGAGLLDDNGKINQRFLAEMNRLTVTREALSAIAPGNQPGHANPGLWIRNNPTKTLKDLLGECVEWMRSEAEKEAMDASPVEPEPPLDDMPPPAEEEATQPALAAT